MQLQIKLGDIYVKDQKDYRVVRIVENDTTMFETPTRSYQVRTSYAQLKAVDGSLEFHIFFEQEIDIPRLPDGEKIRGLDPSIWRKR